jgi:hypothetical protein
VWLNPEDRLRAVVIGLVIFEVLPVKPGEGSLFSVE